MQYKNVCNILLDFSKLPIDFVKKYAILLQSIGVSTDCFAVPSGAVAFKVLVSEYRRKRYEVVRPG